jgi:hypothetical protein
VTAAGGVIIAPCKYVNELLWPSCDMASASERKTTRKTFF